MTNQIVRLGYDDPMSVWSPKADISHRQNELYEVIFRLSNVLT